LKQVDTGKLPVAHEVEESGFNLNVPEGKSYRCNLLIMFQYLKQAGILSIFIYIPKSIIAI
jgi:hypothetical protein